jgi:hypothetical protein
MGNAFCALWEGVGRRHMACLFLYDCLCPSRRTTSHAGCRTYLLIWLPRSVIHVQERHPGHPGGDTDALRDLTRMREEAGDSPGAEALCRQAADRGDTEGLRDLTLIREEAGDTAGAEALRRFGVTGASSAAVELDFGAFGAA